MSRNVWIRCTKHDPYEVSDNSINRGDEELLAAVRTAPLLALLRESGAWDLSSLTTVCGYSGFASFVAEHAACNAFEVVDEYGGVTPAPSEGCRYRDGHGIYCPRPEAAGKWCDEHKAAAS